MARRGAGVLVLALLVTLGLVTGCTGTPSTPAGSTIRVFEPADRKPAPALTGDLLDGTGSFRLADHAGEIVVINFWASWCGPCVAEADDLEAAYLATKDQKVTFLGINSRDDRDPAKNFLVGRQTYPSVFDPSGKLALGFPVATAIPSTIVVDRSGRVAAVAPSAVLSEDLESVVTKLAKESS